MSALEFGIFLELPTTEETVDRQLDRYLPLLELAEKQGFQSVWAGESYPREGGGLQHVPSPLLVLAALARSTSMALGTAITILPVWEPLRLAYDTIMMDHISSGRFSLGVGVGNAATWRQFGLDPATVGQRTDEMIQALRALWRGDSGYNGELIHVEGGIGPRPIRVGGPPIWVGGNIARSARRAAEFGDGYLAGTHFRFSHVREQITRYRDALTGLGRDPASGAVSVNRILVLAEDPDQAWAESAPWVGRLLRAYVRMKILPGAEALAEAAPDDLAALKLVASDICLIGSPETVLPDLEAYRAAGVSQIQVRPAPAGLPGAVAARTIRLAGQSLIPHFSSRA